MNSLTLMAGVIMFCISSLQQAVAEEVLQQRFSDAPAQFKSAQQLPRITIEGHQFVKPDGSVFVFRGLALADPASLDERGQWGRGYFEKAKEWNANVVRIPVHPQAWRTKGEQDYLRYLDDAVRWSSELGLYVIIDWHTIGNMLNGVYHRADYITSKEETFRFWYQIANRYKGNPTVALYELYNEPTNAGGQMGLMPWSDYKRLMEELIYMIRQIDDAAIPLVAGFDWGYDLSYVKDQPIAVDRVAYVTHPYPQKRSGPWQERWQQDWGYVAERYPVIATEFGFMSADGAGAHEPVIGDETYGKAIIEFFEHRGISWTPWVFDVLWTPALLDDWNYTPSRQGLFFKAELQRLNQPQDAAMAP